MENINNLKVYIRKQLYQLKTKRDFDRFWTKYNLENEEDMNSISDSEGESYEYFDFMKSYTTKLNSPSVSSFSISYKREKSKISKRWSNHTQFTISDRVSLSKPKKEGAVSRARLDSSDQMKVLLNSVCHSSWMVKVSDNSILHYLKKDTKESQICIE